MIVPSSEFQFVNGQFKKHTRSIKDKNGVAPLVLGPGGKSSKPVSRKRKLGEGEAIGGGDSMHNNGGSSDSVEHASPGEMSDRVSSATPQLQNSIPRLLEPEQEPTSTYSSPLLASAILNNNNKRPRLEKSMTWANPQISGEELLMRPSSAPMMMSRQHSQPSLHLRVPGGEEIDDSHYIEVQHAGKFRRLSSHEPPPFAMAPSHLVIPRPSSAMEAGG